MSLNILFWPRENERTEGTDNYCEFAMKLSTYLPCVIDINLFKSTFTVVFNYFGGW